MTFLHRVAYAWPSHFWPIWLLGLALVLAFPHWMFGRGIGERQSLNATDRRASEAVTPSWFMVVCFAIFLIGYLCFMFWGEDFAYKDGHSFTEFSAIGKPRPPAIWPDSGRFWPLGYQEYNLIARLSPTAVAYLAFGAIQLLVALWLLYLALPCESPTLRFLPFVLLLLAPAFGADFAELTYADRNVVFCICVLIFAVDRYDRRATQSWLLIAVAVSYAALYFKETSVALFGGFAAIRLLLKLSRAGLPSVLQSPLEVGILLSCACFAVELGLTLLPAGTSTYVDALSVGRGAAALRYLRADPILATFVVAFCLHVVVTVREGAKFDLLWDPLAAGAVLHLAAVSSTGVAETYLLGPSELIGAVTLLRLFSHWWKARPGARLILACICVATVVPSLAFGSFRLIQRKIVVLQTQKVADFLANFYRTPDTRNTRLYFLAEDGVVMNFVSFLSYRGLKFRCLGEPADSNAIDVAGAAAFEGDRCVPSSDFVCRHDLPRDGDLVARLPEESWSAMPAPGSPDVEHSLHAAKLELLFEARPGGLFSSLRPLIAVLYRVSPTLTGQLPDQRLSDDWLRVAVSRVVTPKRQSLAAP